ncbi:glycosyltransferase family 2 protein [Flavivirga eckloniae]|uniref:glycosyltransferase family 2 protein n=1 Tax=Flavivirga eckloniae TaxID=1803846 RepID=UPI00131555C7|nr:glycosyltransferase family 2 protein [Flavivirga eckloniae]
MKIQLYVVIPVFNEEEIIKAVVEDWITLLNKLKISYKLKIFNDGSTDSTLEELKMLKNHYPNCIELIDQKNSGHGPTILRSYRESLDSEWIFQVDSDNEIKAHYFEDFWKVKDNYDFIIGKRVNRNSPVFRKIMTYFSYLVVKYFYGKGIKDVNCPYRLMRTNVFKDIFMNIPDDTFAPNIIISGMALRKGLNVNSFDIEFNTSVNKVSSLSSNITKLARISVNSFLEIINYARKKEL